MGSASVYLNFVPIYRFDLSYHIWNAMNMHADERGLNKKENMADDRPDTKVERRKTLQVSAVRFWREIYSRKYKLDSTRVMRILSHGSFNLESILIASRG